MDLPTELKQKLRDPAYLDLHLVAVSALRDVARVPWYDAHFLKQFEAAKKFLQLVRPDAVGQFVAGFEPLQDVPDQPIQIEPDFFAADLYDEVRTIAAAIPQQALENHEIADFGRHVVHNHAFFTTLQKQVQPRVEAMAGRALEPGYNFLSLYGGAGRCAPHMDEPVSMYTLDYCIDQSGPWPIHFSNLVDWPDEQAMANWSPTGMLDNPAVTFSAHELEPNQALLFTGSSRWHYRDEITSGGFCNLLFLHYYPAGCAGLVYPAQWAEHFAIPEMEPLCDLFRQTCNV